MGRVRELGLTAAARVHQVLEQGVADEDHAARRVLPGDRGQRDGAAPLEREADRVPVLRQQHGLSPELELVMTLYIGRQPIDG